MSEVPSPPVTPPVVILDRPQLAENIGAAARVMANFGLSELRLVSPRDGWPQSRAWASASGADWPLDGARAFPTVAEAVADLKLVYAATARPRETQLPVLEPREAAGELHAAVSRGWRAGLLFGAERAGLETSDIALSHGVVTVPVDPRFRSLNLAQAVAVNAYEWALASGRTAPASFDAHLAEPADGAEALRLYEHLEEELEASGFFFPPENKPSMIRNLRVALGRARLTSQEVRTFRGVITALVKAGDARWRGWPRGRARRSAGRRKRTSGTPAEGAGQAIFSLQPQRLTGASRASSMWFAGIVLFVLAAGSAWLLPPEPFGDAIWRYGNRSSAHRELEAERRHRAALEQERSSGADVGDAQRGDDTSSDQG